MAGLPPYAGSTKTKDGEFLTAVSKVPILNGQLLTISFTGTDVYDARHSLGRPYVGVIVVSSSDATSTPMITALDAGSAAKTGLNPSEYVALGAQTSWTGTVTLWVFQALVAMSPVLLNAVT